MNCKAVIFDLDGTLVDSVADIACAANRALQERGLPPRPVDQYRFFIGEGAQQMMRKAAPAAASEAEIAGCLESFIAFYAERFDVSTKLYDGVAEMLCALCEKSVALAVLSNKPQEITSRIAQSLLSGWNFRRIVGHDGTIPRKPDPSAAIELCGQISVPAQQTAFVGDSGIDMKTAVAAGMIPIGVLWGLRDRDELTSNGARYLISRPAELLQIIARL